MPFRHRLANLAIAAIVAIAAPASAAPNWVRSWAAPPTELPHAWQDHPLPPMSNVTFRMVARVSAGGTSVRLRLSNELTDTPTAVGAVVFRGAVSIWRDAVRIEIGGRS